tara:strand:+ start:196 stop:468 length:273 start_codon:yes stop_codon:yes gene_type:complete
MTKIKEINGNNYSKEEIENYKHRVKVDFNTKARRHSIDLYTTQSNRDLIWEDISNLTTDKVVHFEITHIATKEQDDSASASIDKWLLNES